MSGIYDTHCFCFVSLIHIVSLWYPRIMINNSYIWYSISMIYNILCLASDTHCLCFVSLIYLYLSSIYDTQYLCRDQVFDFMDCGSHPISWYMIVSQDLERSANNGKIVAVTSQNLWLRPSCVLPPVPSNLTGLHTKLDPNKSKSVTSML